MNSLYMYGFIKQVAILYPTFVILFTFRGFFQALVARVVGDDTPEENGFLTLNPLAHIDVFGVLLLALLFASLERLQNVGGGIVSILLFAAIMIIGVRPYYPVFADARNFKWPRLGVVATTLSTTIIYLLLTLASVYALVWGHYYLGGASAAFIIIQQMTGSIIEWATFWAVISLIPLPPFDAAALLPVFFGDMGQELHDFLEQYALFIFFGLFFIPGVSSWFLYALSVLRALVYQGLLYLVIVPA